MSPTTQHSLLTTDQRSALSTATLILTPYGSNHRGCHMESGWRISAGQINLPHGRRISHQGGGRLRSDNRLEDSDTRVEDMTRHSLDCFGAGHGLDQQARECRQRRREC